MSEYLIRNSLTSKSDLLGADQPCSGSGRDIVLTTEEIKEALKELVVKGDGYYAFPKVEKLYKDPVLPNQNVALLSFVPSKGATPDKDGVYGLVKVRGVFPTESEAMNRAEFLIRGVDSFHKIYYTTVGVPFVLSKNVKANDVKEIDVRKKVAEVVSENIRENRDEENNTINDMKEKEKELLSDVKEDKVFDPVDRCTELNVKKSHLSFTYVQTAKKMLEMKTGILKCREEIAKLFQEYPECEKEYRQRYMDARKKSGLPDDDESFLKYLGTDNENEIDFSNVQY
jgi:hypothetical protein